MDSDRLFFYVFRVVCTSITHGILLSVLIRSDEHSRKMVHAAMALLTLLISVLGSIIIIAVPSVLVHTTLTAYMMLVVMGLFFCFISSGSALTERLFIYIMYVAVFMLSVGYSNLIVSVLPVGNKEYAQLAVRTAFSAVLLVLLKVSLLDRLYKVVDGLSVHGLEITMFSWLIGLCVLEYSLISSIFVDNPVMNLVVLLLLTFMIISIFAIASRIVHLTEREVEAERIEGMHRLLESELEAERIFVEKAKEIRHDQRHHDRIVLEYLDEGNIEEARRYLGAHGDSVESDRLQSWCGNQLVDAQLRIACRSCLGHGIAFTADIRLGESFVMDDADFVSVMGNLLENAIHAAEGTESPSVAVFSRVMDDKLLLEIKNSAADHISLSEGTGLGSVKRILSQYDGLLLQDSSDGFVISRVIIPLGD